MADHQQRYWQDQYDRHGPGALPSDFELHPDRQAEQEAAAEYEAAAYAPEYAQAPQEPVYEDEGLEFDPEDEGEFHDEPNPFDPEAVRQMIHEELGVASTLRSTGRRGRRARPGRRQRTWPPT
jgi:hypothetical protein